MIRFVTIWLDSSHFYLFIVCAFSDNGDCLRGGLPLHLRCSSSTFICIILVVVVVLSMRILNNWLPFKYFSNFTFIYRLSSIIKFKFVATAAHTKNFEAVDFGDESRGWQYWIIEMLDNKTSILNCRANSYLKEYMGETSSKVSTINVQLFLTRQVHVDASWAVYFDAGRGKFFRDSNG